MTDPTYLGLLDDILSNPADDTPRLILADWFSENGQEERAEFIRDGIAICYPERLNPDHDMGQDWDGTIDIIAQYPPQVSHCELCATISRQRLSLLRKDIASSIGDIVGLPADWSGRRDSGMNYVGVRVRRGFVSELRLPLATWEQHGQAIARQHPVEVVMTDRKPDIERIKNDGTGFTWVSDSDWIKPDYQLNVQCLPKSLWEKVQVALYAWRRERNGYLPWTPEDAIAALSRALIQHARTVAPTPEPAVQ